MSASRRGRPVAAALLTLSLLAAGCTGSDSDGEGEGSTGPTETVAPDPADGGWVRSASDALAIGQPGATLMATLGPSADGEEWLVAGIAFDERGGPKATVWRSPDATVWSAVTLEGGDLTEALGIVRTGDEVVVVGRERLAGGRSKAAVWRGDGRRFTAVDGGEAFAGSERVAMVEVTPAPGGGLVATGVRSEPGAADAVAVWRSADGAAWERLAPAEEVFARSSLPLVNRLVTFPGGVVAVGSTGPQSELDGVAWFSADGATWEQATAAPDFAGPGVQELNDALVGGAGVFAVGTRNDGRLRVPAAWTSADGRSWRPSPATFEQQQGGSDVFGTAVDAVARTATGYAASGGGTFVKRVWTSTDLASWNEVALPDSAGSALAFNLFLMAAGGDDVLTASTIDGIPVVLLRRGGRWTEASARSNAFPVPRPEVCCARLGLAKERLVMTASAFGAGKSLGRERTDARSFTSDDGGLTWKRGSDTPFSHAEANAIAPLADGGVMVAGGHQYEAGFPDQGPPTFLTWTSADGEAWRRSPTQRPGDTNDIGGTRRLNGVAVREDRVVVAGEAYNGTDTDGAVLVRTGTEPFRTIAGIAGMDGPDDVTIGAVCAGPAGFVVVGSVRKGTETDAAAWFSPDGDTWQQASGPAFGGAGLQRMDGCQAAGSGFVAVGVHTAADADAGVWTSADGRSWQRSAAPELGGEGPQTAVGVVADGDRWLVVGNDVRNGEFTVAQWQSDDAGATWRRPTLGPVFSGRRTQQATDVLLAGGRVVVAGMADGRPAAWSSPWPISRSG